MNKTLIALSLTLASISHGVTAQDHQCGRVEIADVSNQSASFFAKLDKRVLEKVFNCEVELVPAQAGPVLLAMIERQKPDITPEYYLLTNPALLALGEREGKIKVSGAVFAQGSQQGFYIPRFLLERYPEMKTLQGVLAHKSLFKHPEDDSKLALYGCPAGWYCQITVAQQYKAYNLEAMGFEIVDPGSPAALAATFARSVTREEPIIGYYWTPSPLLTQYPLVKVDLGGVDEQEFNRCITKVDCPDPKPTDYPIVPVQSLVTTSFIQQYPHIASYLDKRSFPNEVIGEVLAFIEHEGADADEAVDFFLTTHKKLWQSWFSEDQAKKLLLKR